MNVLKLLTGRNIIESLKQILNSQKHSKVGFTLENLIAVASDLSWFLGQCNVSNGLFTLAKIDSET
jgi:hypothetical protein